MLKSTPSRSHHSAARTAVVVSVVLLVVGTLLAGYGLTHNSHLHTPRTAATVVTSAAAVTSATASATPTPSGLPVGVVPFIALPVGSPPSPGAGEGGYPWHALVATLVGPGTVQSGRTNDYRLRLTNATSAPIPLDPCPAYDLSVGLHTSSYGLNCAGAPAGPIAPGATLTLDLPVPVAWSLSSGTKTDIAFSLGWQPDKSSPKARLTVTVK
ncbi:MAG: hypothetical protein QOJ11_1471 [Frankiales bacterium]|nr:hypothetical protein [Frankiales bacterium]